MGDDPMTAIIVAADALLDCQIGPLARALADVKETMQRDATRVQEGFAKIGAALPVFDPPEPVPPPPPPEPQASPPPPEPEQHPEAPDDETVNPMQDSTEQQQQEAGSTPKDTPVPAVRTATPKAVMLTRKHAAGYLGFESVKQLDNLLHAGLGPPRVRFGRSVHFKIADLDAWIEAHREK